MDEFETQDILCGGPLTCKRFVEEFNAISEDYTLPQFRGGISNG